MYEFIDLFIRIAIAVHCEFHQNGENVDLFDEPSRRSRVERSDLVRLGVDLHDALSAVGH